MFGLFLNFQATFPPREQQACHLEQCLTHTPPAWKLQLFVLKEKNSKKLSFKFTRVLAHTCLKTEDSQPPACWGERPDFQNRVETVEVTCVKRLVNLQCHTTWVMSLYLQGQTPGTNG